jgi:hypothetical protein
VRLASAAPDCLVDTRALLAAASAKCGDVASAREHAACFVRNFSQKIALGREPAPGEPLSWILRVNPHRRPEDSEYWLEGLRTAGLG